MSQLNQTEVSSPPHRIPASLPGILLLFGLSRAYYIMMGVEYDDAHLRIAWQFLDPELLRENLFQSLWYLHAQPPLFNFFCGLVVKLAPNTPTDILNPVFILLGLLNLMTMDALMRSFGVMRWIRWPMLLMVAFNPSFNLVENWFFYTHPLACMMTFATWGWFHFSRTKRTGWIAFVFALMFAMVMIRSLFHVVWLVVISAVAVWIFRGIRRKVAVAAVIPVVIILLWYLKTYLMFGTFGASTWLGMSMAKNTTFRLSEQERAALVKEGTLSPVAMIVPFSRFTWYRDYIQKGQTGIPVLDRIYNPSGSINFNNISMIELCKLYEKDAKWSLRHYPLRALESQIDSWENYCQTTSTYMFLQVNRAKIPFMDKLYERGVYFQFTRPKKLNKRPGTFFSFFQPIDYRPFSPMIALLFLVAAVWLPWRAWILWRDPETRSIATTLIFIWLNVMYVSCIGNLLEIGENNRFRFMIEPVSWVVFASFLTWVCQGIRRRSVKPSPALSPT